MKLWTIKVNFLILGLGLVIYIMFQIKNSGLPPTALNLMGIQAPSKIVRHNKDLMWCQTRVQSMEKPKSFKIYQDKLKWFTSGQSPQEIDFITVEKWFGQNCSLKVEPLPKETIDPKNIQTALIINFIKGTTEHLFKLEPNVYAWKGQVFRSPQMESALNQLTRISHQTLSKEH